jgi:hypothetical protein
MIRADKPIYPPKRFPKFWEWLHQCGDAGSVKIPEEQYKEITDGTGPLVDWLKDEDVRNALKFSEEADPAVVAMITSGGYAEDLNDVELEKIGCDPFIVSYAFAAKNDRCVVTFETSATSKQRANRKLPDVCNDFGVKSITLYDMIEALDFHHG